MSTIARHIFALTLLLVFIVGVQAGFGQIITNAYVEDLATLKLVVFPEPVTAPNVKLPNLEGTIVALAAYLGKVILLNFRATW